MPGISCCQEGVGAETYQFRPTADHLRYTYNIAGYLSVVQAFATLAFERNVGITEYVINESVHSRFLELATFSSFTRKISRSLDLFGKEVADI